MRTCNFYCLDCKKSFRKTTDLETITTDYGERPGIVCPLCGGRAKYIGQPSILGGTSQNGIADSAKFINLD